MDELKTPLSNVQIELLKLYSTDLSDEELAELKEMLSTFYAKKAIRHADQVWDSKKLSDVVMEEWLNDEQT
ncbi:MAG: hypothetical protein NXI08_05165 [bacterium]|nr:hypothetical protein [bacterium]